MITKSYIDTPQGQIHLRSIGASRGREPDLYLLHPAPFSGLAFTGIMPMLAENRSVIAPDFPGHGGSDPFSATPGITDYAEAMLAVVGELSGGEPADLLGFHTGCLVAAEMSLHGRDHIRRLVLIDSPAFEPDVRTDQLGKAAKPPELTADITSIAPMWERGITRRIESQGIDRSFEMFTEQLRHGKTMHAAFHAGFSYDVEGRLPRIKHPTTIIASQSGLLGATRRTAELIPGAKLIERLDIKRAVLDEAAAETAKSVLEALA